MAEFQDFNQRAMWDIIGLDRIDIVKLDDIMNRIQVVKRSYDRFFTQIHGEPNFVGKSGDIEKFVVEASEDERITLDFSCKEGKIIGMMFGLGLSISLFDLTQQLGSCEESYLPKDDLYSYSFPNQKKWPNWLVWYLSFRGRLINPSLIRMYLLIYLLIGTSDQII